MIEPSTPAADDEDQGGWVVDTTWSGVDLEAAYSRALAALDVAQESADQLIDSAPVAATDPSAAVKRTALAPSPERGAPAGIVDPAAPDPSITPRQVLEACLFVGGDPLPAKRLANVLRGDFTAEKVDELLADLNRQYAAEERPYEVQLVEGGYQLALREPFERIRRKVYGLGPKEVRLSQDALEVLALVAYHQPIDEARVGELGKPGSGVILRQLVRRELLAIVRAPEDPQSVQYVVTPRCLSLFGVGSVNDLPRPEALLWK